MRWGEGRGCVGCGGRRVVRRRCGGERNVSGGVVEWGERAGHGGGGGGCGGWRCGAEREEQCGVG